MARNVYAGRVEQSLNKEALCRALDSAARAQEWRWIRAVNCLCYMIACDKDVTNLPFLLLRGYLISAREKIQNRVAPNPISGPINTLMLEQP